MSIGILLSASATASAGSYTDTHDDGSTSGWTAHGVTSTMRTWSESGGYMLPQESSNNAGFLINDYAAAANGTFNFTLKFVDTYNGKYGGGVFRYIDSAHFYYVRLEVGNAGTTDAGNKVFMCTNTIASTGCTMVASNLNYTGLSPNYPIRVVTSGSTFNFYLNGSYIGQVTDATNASGKVGYAYSIQYQGSSYLQFDRSDWTDSVNAATRYTWTGNTSTDWGTSTNWSPNGVPGASDSIVVDKSGGATIALNGDRSVRTITLGNSSSNAMTIQQGSSGTLTIASGGTVSSVSGSTGSHVISSPVALSSTLTTTVSNSSGSIEFSGVVSGSYGMTKAGTGTMKLSGANTYTGTTTASAGTIRMGNTAGLGGTGSGTTIQSGATLDLNGYAVGAEPIDIAGTGVGGLGAIINSGAEIQSGLRFLTLSADASIGGSNRFDLRWVSGGGGEYFNANNHILTKLGSAHITFQAVAIQNFNGIVVSAGTFGAEENATFPSGGSGFTVQSGATLFLWRSNGSTAPVSMNNATLIANNGAMSWGGTFSLTGANTFQVDGTSLTLSGVISGTGSLTKTGANPLILSAANTYTGTTTVSSGTLQLGIANALPSASAVTVNGTLDMYGYSDAIGSLAGSGTIDNTSGTGTYTLTSGGDNTSTTFSGIVKNTSGAVAMTKVGSGTLTLSGNNAFSGGYTHSAGNTTLGHSNALGTGAVTMNGTGQLSLNNGVNIANTATMSACNAGIGNGAINSVSGANATWSGTINVNSDCVNGGHLSGAADQTGSLTISGALNMGGAATWVQQRDGLVIYSGGGNATRIDLLKGTARLGATNGLPSGALFSQTHTGYASTLDLYGYSQTFLGLHSPTNALTSITNSQAGLGTLTLNGSTDTTYLGAITGNLALVKSGAYRQSLGGANTFTGSTTISAGTLQLASATGVSSSSAMTVDGTLNLNGFSATVASLAGSGTVDNTNTTAGTYTLTTGGNNSSTTFSGVIKNTAQTVAITKQGSGTQTLSGNNTYTGATTVNAGTLVLSGQSASATNSIASGAVLELNYGSNTVLTGNKTFSGAGTLRKTGAGSAEWGTAAATFALSSGALIDVQAGILKGGSFSNEVWTNNYSDLNVASGASFHGVEGNVRVDALTGAGTISSGYNVDYTAFTFGVDNGSGDFTGVLSNQDGTYAANFIKVGSGTQTLSGANTYTGTTTVSAGTLKINNTSALGTTAGATTVASGAVLDLNGVNYASAEPLTLNGSGISSGGALTNQSASAATFGGLVTLGSDARVSTNSGTIALTNTGTISGSGYTLTLAGSGNGTLASVIGVGAGGLIKNGTGTWTISGASTYSGTTSILQGALKTGAASAIPSGSAVTVTGTLDLNGYNQTVGSLAGAGTVDNTSASAGTYTLTTGADNSSTTFSGVIKNTAQAVALTKSGSGTLTLSGINTFSGATTVNTGTLLVTGTDANSAVTVNTGATLGGTGSVGAVNVPSGGILAPGVSGAGTLSTGAMTMASGSVLNVDLDATSDKILITGNLSLAGTVNVTPGASFGPGTYTLFTFSNSLTSNTLAVGSIPAGYSGQVVQSGNNVNLVLTKSLTVTGSFTANSKTYDGATSATINVNSLALSGVVGADVVTLSPTLVFASASVGAGKTVSLTGSSLAGADAAKYTLSLAGAPTTTASITAKSLTVGGSFTANDKPFDNTTAATINTNSLTLTGVVGGDVVTLSPTLVFASASVGTGKTVSLTGSTLGGAAASNYTLSLAGAPTTTASITTKTLTITGSFTANNKTYDGATSATINTNSLALSGIVGSDVVTLSPTLVFATATVGAGKTVSLTGSTLGGANAANYTLSLSGAPTTTASITAKSLTVDGSFTANDKAFDNTTAATINTNSLTLTGVVGADVVTLSPTLVFSDAAIGAGKTVSLTGSTIGGASASNYTLSLSGAPTTTASITTKTLTVTGSFTANNKTYDGTTAATINGNSLSLSGVVGTDVVTLSPTLVFATATVGAGKTVSLTGSTLGGANASNYTLSLSGAPTTTASITAKTLTVGGSFTANDKAFDNTTAATINTNSLTLTGVVGADVVTLSPTLVFSDAAIGAGKTVSLTGSAIGGASASNYTLSLAGAPTTTASITTKTLTVGGSFTANNKAYDGTTSATINANSLSLIGVVGGDVVTLSPTLVFATATVGAGKTVSLTGSTLGGANAANYTLSLSGAPTTTASITTKTLTVDGSFTALDKAYDNTTPATIDDNSLSLVGVVGGDVVTLTPTLVFADANVGAGKAVSLTGSTIGGASASNYTLSLAGAPTASASITAKSLTVTGSFTANNKTYDGTTVAAINSNGLGLSGVVGADVVTLSPTLAFSSASVGTGKTVSLTGSTLGGANASNYTLSLVGAPTATASITAKSVTITGTFTANDKVYDGTTTGSINANSLALNGVLGGDVVTLTPGLVFADENVGAGKSVSLTGSSLGGAAASEYSISYVGAPTATASITVKSLTIGGSFTANDKPFDNTTAATISVNGLTLVGKIASDDVSLSPTVEFSDAVAAPGKTVSITGGSLSGADASNYTLSLAGAPTTTASITSKGVTISGTFTAIDKIYDGTVGATINADNLVLDGIVGGEDVTLVPVLVFEDAAVGGGKVVTLNGSTLGGAHGSEYSISFVGAPTTTASITAKTLTVGGTFTVNNKSYDGSATATINNNSLTLDGVVGSDDVALSPAPVFADAEVGAGKTVSLTGSSLTGGAASNYTLSLGGAPTTTASITATVLTVAGTFTANNKTYDGTTTGTINTNGLSLSGVVGTEDVTLVPALVFADATVGGSKTVSLSGSTLAGTDAGKYTLSLAGAPTTTAAITAKSLTVGGSFTANDKPYDGTTGATINTNSLTLTGIVGADAVTLSPTLVFADAAVGVGKTVSLTGSTLGGAAASNYTLSLGGAPTATASITAQSLTIAGSFTANDKTYDGATGATIGTNALALSGIVGGDDVTLVPTLVFADAAVGVGKTVSLTGSTLAGTDAGKYSLSLAGAPTTTAAVTAKSLTVGGSFTANNKSYDGTTVATINTNSLTLTGIVGADAVTLSPTLVFADAAVGVGKTVSLTGSTLDGAAASNYTLSLGGAPTATASITSAALTITGSFTANDKTYDGATGATINSNTLSLSGIIGSDVVTLTPSLVFADADVGTGKTVSLTGSTLGGADAGKYTLSFAGAPTTAAAITVKTLTVGGSFTANNKSYDGTTVATIGTNSLTLTGIVGADAVTLSPTLVFADAAVGVGKTVSLTGSTLGGAAASNYTLSLGGAPTATASITSTALTITGSFTANDKTYDGATGATINSNTLSLSGIIGSDVVTLTPSLVFADASVGAGKTVSLTGSSLAGADAGKYTLSLAGAPTTAAAITVKTLTVGGSFTANNKSYDGTTVATISTNSLTLTGIVGADVVTLSPTLVFADAAVGVGKTVSLTGSTLGGAAASNYTLSLGGAPTATASITSTALTITGSFTANDKTYDGATGATINSNTLSLSGIIGSDVVTLTPSLVFADADVGTGKSVSLTGSTLGGADAGKYTLSFTGAPTTAAAITVKTLTVGGSFTANNKSYDGTTVATISTNSLTLTGIVGGDAVTLSPTLVFADAAVGAGKTVSLTGSSLGGGAASNYTLSLVGAPTATASITAQALTIAGSFTANDKTYDGAVGATINTNSLTLSGIVGSDVVTLVPAVVFADAAADVGKTVSLTGSSLAGADAGKYTLSLVGAPTATASVTPKSLSVGGSFTAHDKSYDGTTVATINTNSLTLSGVVGADVVTISPTPVFADAAVGVGKTVSLTGSSLGGGAASNYTLSLAGAPTATASITAQALTIAGSFTANDKTYDGSTTATINGNGLTLNGIVGADVVTLVPALVFADAVVGTGKTVNLTGSTLAGADAGKYTLSLAGAPTATAAVTPKTLTVGGSFTAQNKAYDGTTSATINVNSLTLTGIVGADAVTFSPTLVFADASVGTGKSVSLAGSSLAGAAASNYALSLAGAPTATASITVASVTVTGSFSTSSKTYDGNTSATLTGNGLSLVGIGTDDVILVPVLGFSDAAVGSGKTVSLTGSTLAGADAGKYSISFVGAPTDTASILPRTLTVGGSFTANDKGYDGTNAATINANSLTLTGVVGADAVNLVPTPVFDDPAIGTGKTVSLTGSSLAGAASSNYTLSLAGAPTTTASITSGALTVGGSFTANDKTYDGSNTATINASSLTLNGIAGGDVVTLVPVLVFADSAVGAGKTVSLTGSTLAGADAGKYTLSLSGAPTATASILPRTLTVGGSFTANDKGYDGTTSATINTNSLTLTGVVGADDASLVPTLVFADAAIGTGKTVSLTGSTLAGAAASNYALSLTGAPTATAAINSVGLTISGSFTANDKTYDGSNTATINANSLTLNGIAGGDVVTLVPVLVFADSAAGAGKAVSLTGSTLAGADAGKYALSLSGAPTATASITPKTLTVGGSFTAADKLFDNTTSATIGTNALTLSGVVGSDDVSLVPTLVFADAAIGVGKTVSLAGSGLTGAAAPNYTLSLAGAPTATASIASLALTITGSFTANDKIYDGTNAATIGTNGLTLSGVAGGDVVTLVPVLVFGDSAVGAGKTVSLTGSSLAGADAGKYTLSLTGAPTATASIAAKSITITPAAGQGRAYGDADSAFAYGNSEWADNSRFTGNLGRVPGDSLGTYAYTLGTLSVGSNYVLALAGSAPTYAIAPRPITITANAQNKLYGSTLDLGTSAYSVTAGSLVSAADITGVSLSSAGAVDTASTGTYPIVPSAAVGPGVANYAITYANGVLTVGASPNAAPSFAKGPDQTILEDAGAQTVPNWATTISMGPAFESAQTPTFVLTNSNNALFGAQPAISADGTLTYAPAADANGSATVTVVLRDDGGTAGGGVDSSAAQTFTISVAPVNDAPSFAKGADQSLLQTAVPQNLSGWATSVSNGPADESSQARTFVVTNSNNTLFATQPAIGSDGTLSFALSGLTSGSATVSVVLRDDGGTSDGGVDSSAAQTFDIVVGAVNRAPSFAKGADQVVLEDAGAQRVANWATAISTGPANESSQSPSFVLTSDNSGLFSAQPAVSSTGELTFTPAANANGRAVVAIAMRDNGGTANGGVDSSAPQTFEIRVTGVNDAPDFAAGADIEVDENSGSFSRAWATSVSKGPGDEASQSVAFHLSSDAPNLFGAQPAIDSTGVLTFATKPYAYGVATVTVRMSDNGGVANGGVDSATARNFRIQVRHVVANIHPPVVTTGAGAASVTDSVLEGTVHAVDFRATDADTISVLRYAIAGGADAARFSIDSLTGVLSFSTAPDHENPSSSAGTNTYTVVLQVGDGLHVATQTHHVQVHDRFEPTDPPKRLVLSPDTIRLLIGDSARFALSVLANTGGVLSVDPSRIAWSWSPSLGTQSAGTIKADRIGRSVVKATLGTIVDSAIVVVGGLEAVIPPSSTTTNHNVGSGITVSVPPHGSPVQIAVEPAPAVAVGGMVVSDKSVLIGAKTDSIPLGLSVPVTTSKAPPGRTSSDVEVFRVDSLGGMIRIAPVVAAGDSAVFTSKGPGKYVLAWDTTPPVVRMRVARDSVRTDSLDVWYWLDGNSPDDTTSLCTRLAGSKGGTCKDVHTGDVDSGLVRIARTAMPFGAELWVAGRDAYNKDATVRRNIVVHHDTLRSPAPLPEDRYDLVSIPYFDSARVPLEEMARVFGEYDIRRWRAYRTTSSGFEEIQGGSRDAVGGAWWIRTRNAKSAPWYGDAWTTPVSRTVEIRLHPGWNAVGNPYGFDVDWNAILDSSKLDSGAINGPYRYQPRDQSWSIPDSTRLVEAWHGVVVRNNTLSSLVLRIPSVAWSAAAARATGAKRVLRRLEIVASQTDAGSARIAAGIDSLASIGIDRMDHPMPPVPGRVLNAFFPSPDRTDSSTRFLTDVRPETDSGIQWTFKVTGLKARTPVLLRPPANLEGLADTLWLMDQKSGSVYPWTAPIEFAVGNEIQRSFIMAIGARPAARLAAGFGIVCKRNLVKWSLPPEFARSRVRVNVFDFNGRLISNVIDEEEDPGSYSTSLKNVVRSHAPHVVVLDAGGHRASVVYLPVRGP